MCKFDFNNELELIKSSLDHLTLQGFRIISMGYKELIEDIEDFEKIKREKIEENIIFLGFIIFENPLKEDTANVITTLRDDGKLNLKIISGGKL